ncbi:MAG: ABC transporter substrate-binding protein [Longimicrobiales bacterium]
MRTTAIGMMLLAAVGCSEPPYSLGVWAGPTGANVAKMAQNDINYKGGISDRRMVTRVVSQRTVSFNELTPEILGLSLDSMAADTMVRALVMRMTDSVTEAAAQEFESLSLPYLITNPVPASYTQTHPNAFLLVPTVEEQAEFLAQQAQAEPAPRRAALFSLREPHADSLAAAITRALSARGIPIVFATSFSQSADRYTMQAKANETTSHRPTIILFIGRTPSLYETYGTFLNRTPKARVIASDLAETFHLYGNPGQRYTGVRFVRFFDPLSPDSVTTNLRDRLWGWIGRDELNSEAAVTYEALNGLAQVMNTGALTRASLSRALRSGARMNGLLGEWQFDGQRRVNRPIYLAEIRADTVVLVASNNKGALARQ